MSNTTLTSSGAVILQGSVFGPGGLTVAGGDISLANAVNTYMGGTTVNGGSLSLGAGCHPALIERADRQWRRLQPGRQRPGDELAQRRRRTASTWAAGCWR